MHQQAHVVKIMDFVTLHQYIYVQGTCISGDDWSIKPTCNDEFYNYTESDNCTGVFDTLESPYCDQVGDDWTYTKITECNTGILVIGVLIVFVYDNCNGKNNGIGSAG